MKLVLADRVHVILVLAVIYLWLVWKGIVQDRLILKVILVVVCLQEIGGYAWHRVADLPATREEGNQTFMSEDGTKHKFFMVSAARRC